MGRVMFDIEPETEKQMRLIVKIAGAIGVPYRGRNKLDAQRYISENIGEYRTAVDAALDFMDEWSTWAIAEMTNG